MLCITYAIAVGLLLGILADVLERLFPPSFPRRWIWCVTIVASFGLPGYYRYHHSVAVGGGLDPAVMTQMAAIDAMIGRGWMIATVLLGLWALVNMGWVSHLVRLSRRQPTGGVASIGGVQVVVTESLGPATVGVWRSSVLLPKWVLAMPEEQRRYIVRHEQEHGRSHDCALLFFASLAVILAPWNLALWLQFRRLSLAVELDCDRRVVSALGDAPGYGRLLLAVAETAGRGRRLQPALLGSTGMLERRLRVMLAQAPLGLAQRVLLPVAAALLLFIALRTPHPVQAAHVHTTPPIASVSH